MTNFVAGAIGYTITWNPNAGQSGNITSLIGLTCTMVAINTTTDVRSGPFAMTVAENGLTASYTTQESTDFAAGGNYLIAFQAVSPDGTLALETAPVSLSVAAPL
jgi:hypothetical protein